MNSYHCQGARDDWKQSHRKGITAAVDPLDDDDLDPDDASFADMLRNYTFTRQDQE